ncbi:MAG TPA: glycosyltransferase family 9 protein [Candidatus Acidoferrum sp.]|jgi:ADP-heptose:LPS heptosyltransferase|nr:glycosyltransferase family 9 protein [Candidatus Acidoferrum sp.]
MEPGQNILLIRLKSIGDILFTLPAVNRVRTAYPQAKLAFLVSRELAPLLEGFRDADAVITLNRARFRGFNPKAVVQETLTLWRRLRRDRFSLAIDFQGYGETALMTWCTGAPQRWGTVYRAGRQWAYTRGVRRDPGPHPAEVHLAMLETCGLPSAPVRNEFILPAGPIELARRFLADAGLDPARPTLFIQPFTSAAEKDWPLDRYLAVARHWRDQGAQVAFGGGPAERAALGPALQDGFPVSAGVPLLVTAGLMQLSTIVVGGDTGVLHLAVALGKRVVMVMGSTGPGSCYPFRHRDWAVVPPSGGPVSSIEVGRLNEVCARAFAELGSSAGMRNPKSGS